MVQDAEINAEADKKARTLIESRNAAEAQLHEVKRDLAEHGDNIDAVEKAAIEDTIAKFEEIIKGDDADKIKEELQKLLETASPLLKKKMEEQEIKASPSNEDNVVDAQFTERKDS